MIAFDEMACTYKWAGYIYPFIKCYAAFNINQSKHCGDNTFLSSPLMIIG